MSSEEGRNKFGNKTQKAKYSCFIQEVESENLSLKRKKEGKSADLSNGLESI